MSRLTTLARQLSLKRFFQLTLAEAVRKLFNSHSTFSYAQDGEDILAMSLLNWPTEGFYVDVGCNLPVARSNTFLFYLRGAHGIGIDANGSFAPAWRKARPRDLFIERCIGLGNRVDFHTFAGHPLSSIGGQKVEGVASDQYRLVEKRAVDTVPLQNVLELHGVPKRFLLLSVDVEGYDEIVLGTLDLRTWRPRLIIIELHNIDFLHLSNHPLISSLSSLDYRLVAAQKSNLFFMDAAG
jgi:hypothetical protein